MKSFFRCSLACAALIFASGRSQADMLIFDNYTSQSSAYNGTTSRNAESAPPTFVTVATTTTISEIGIFDTLSTAGSIKFLIFDGSSSSGALLYSSAPQAFAADTAGNSWKVSTPFSFTLLAGKSYYIGFVANVAMTEPYYVGSSYTQNGITSAGNRNGNVSGFANPALVGDGGAGLPLRLYTAVPEPTSVALLGLGLVGGLAAARRRKAA